MREFRASGPVGASGGNVPGAPSVARRTLAGDAGRSAVQEDMSAMGLAGAVSAQPKNTDTRETEAYLGSADHKITAALLSLDFEKAIRLCVCFYSKSLKRLCSALVRSEAEAEELVQETFLAAYKAFRSSTCRVIENPRSFLYAIARCHSKRLYKKSSTDANLREFVYVCVVSSENQAVLYEQHEQIVKLGEAISLLKDNEQRIVELHTKDGMSFAEVGDIIGISENATRQKFFRIMSKLRASMCD